MFSLYKLTKNCLVVGIIASIHETIIKAKTAITIFCIVFFDNLIFFFGVVLTGVSDFLVIPLYKFLIKFAVLPKSSSFVLLLLY